MEAQRIQYAGGDSWGFTLQAEPTGSENLRDQWEEKRSGDLKMQSVLSLCQASANFIKG